MPEKPQDNENQPDDVREAEQEPCEPADDEPERDYYYDDAYGYEPFVDEDDDV